MARARTVTPERGLRQALARLLDGRQRRILAVLVALGAVGALLEAAVVMLVFAIVRAAGANGADAGPIGSTALGAVLRGTGVETPRAVLLAGVLTLLVLVVAKNLFLTGVHYAQTRFCQQGAAALSVRLFAAYVTAPFAQLTSRHSSELTRNVRDLGNHVYLEVTMALVAMAVEAAAALGVVVVLLALQPLATLLAAGVLATLVLVQQATLGRRTDALGARHLQMAGALLKAVQQALGAAAETRVLAREPQVVAAFATLQRDFSKTVGTQMFLSSVSRYVNESAVVLAVALVAVVLLAGNVGAAALPASLALFAAAAFRLMPAMNRTLNALHVLRYYRASVHLAAAELDRAEAARPAADSDLRPLRCVHGVALDGVSYTYPDAVRPALADVTVEIPFGTSVGIVGPSGAGKTTLACLLLGLLSPDRGHVRVDGVDIAGRERDWQRHLGYVPQDSLVLDEPVRRNVALALDDRDIDDARVWESLRLARLDALVARLPHGLDTVIGERGAKLSGGERQRVGIARALYRDPAVLVLDEATAALDGVTEDEVAAAIRALEGSRTIVVIAHRPATVRQCDRLLFLDEGRLVDQGGFDELAARHPDFARLLDLAGA
ncbi:MAG: ABC transporter ATP-binding protein [Vicinamibacterales bacterium]